MIHSRLMHDVGTMIESIKSAKYWRFNIGWDILGVGRYFKMYQVIYFFEPERLLVSIYNEMRG